MISKFWYGIIAGVLLTLLFLFIFDRCSGDKGTITIETPEVSGEFPPQEPIYIKGKDSIIVQWRDKPIKVPYADPALIAVYRDSIDLLTDKVEQERERFKLYLEAISINDFEVVFDNDDIRIVLTGQAQSKLLNVKPTYTIKPRQIEVEIPKHSRLLIGGEVGNNTMFDNFQYKANLGLQNKAGNIYRVGYSRLNRTDNIWLGFDYSLFRF